MSWYEVVHPSVANQQKETNSVMLFDKLDILSLQHAAVMNRGFTGDF